MKTRLRVWSEQPPEFFTQAIIEGDGTLVKTDAECKQGVDIAYDGDLELSSSADLAGQHR